MKQSALHVPFIPELAQEHNGTGILNILDAKGCKQSVDRVNWRKDFPYQPLTSFSIAHDCNLIYIDFFVRCNFLRAENYIDQSPVTQDSSVAFYISPGCDNSYFIFEFNCVGVINAAIYNDGALVRTLTPAELSSIKRYPSCGTRAFCELEGLFSWNILVTIPLNILGIDANNRPATVTGNFYKCASSTSQPHYMSWSPILSEKPNFHRPQDFGKITLD